MSNSLHSSALPPIIRRSYRDSIIMTLGLIAALNLVLGSLRVLYFEGLSPNLDAATLSLFLGHWQESLIYSGICGGLMALLMPWFVPLAYAEWFYTRPLNFREVFRLMWREYLRWWGLFALGLFCLTLWALFQPIQVLSPLTPTTLLVLLGTNLYLALFLAVDNHTRQRQVQPLYLLMLWGLCVALSVKRWPLIQEISPVVFATLATLTLVWALWLAWHSQKSVVQDVEPPEEMGLNFFAWFAQGSAELRVLSGLQQFWARYRFLTRRSHWLYTGIFTAIALVLGLGVSTGGAPRDYFSYHVFFNSIAIGLLITLIPARFIWSKHAETQLSRSVSAAQVYFFNWFHQGLILCVCMGLGAGLQLLFGGPMLRPQVLLLPLFFWFAGPLASLSLISLMIMAWIIPDVSPGVLLTLLSAPQLSSLALWGIVIGFRLYDMASLKQGLNWQGWARFRDIIRVQVVPAVLVLGAIFWGLNQHPLLRILTQEMQRVERFNAAWMSSSRIQNLQFYGSDDNAFDLLPLRAMYEDDRDWSDWDRQYAGYRPAELQQALSDPYSAETAQLMARSHYLTMMAYLDGDIDTTQYFPQLMEEFKADAELAQAWLRDFPALQQDPELLSLNHFAHQRWLQALSSAEQAYAQTPNARLGLQLGRLQAHFLRFEQARQSYADVAQRYPEVAARAHLLAGRAAQSAGQIDQAAQHYLEAQQSPLDQQLSQQGGGQMNAVAASRYALKRLPIYRSGSCSRALEVLQAANTLQADVQQSVDRQKQLCQGILPQDASDLDASIWLKQRGRLQEALKRAPHWAHGFKADVYRQLEQPQAFERELRQGFKVSYRGMLQAPLFARENRHLLLRLSLLSTELSVEQKALNAQQLLLQTPILRQTGSIAVVFSEQELKSLNQVLRTRLHKLAEDIHRLYQQASDKGFELNSSSPTDVRELLFYKDSYGLEIKHFPTLHKALKAPENQRWE